MNHADSEINNLINHLFRHESGELASVLTKLFGSHNIELAEDVVHDALLEALNIWNYKGIPENPAAWIYTVAKNKAINILKSKKHKNSFSINSFTFPEKNIKEFEIIDEYFTEENIQDDQLRMIFTCCHPSLTQDSQVALILKTLCGFSIPEIARAFITSNETINKKLVRARQKIREAEIPFQIPGKKEINKRLDSVLETIYLLFNEGYSATSGDKIINYDQCEEAIRLSEMLTENIHIKEKSKVFALSALMLFNFSRFNSRVETNGNSIELAEQDRSKWDRKMIEKGLSFFQKSAETEIVSSYHIQAAIAAHHCFAPDFESTKWESILALYDSLLEIDNTPLVLLNRAVVLSKIEGATLAINELEKLKDEKSLSSYHLFYSTLAWLYLENKSYEKAIENLYKAIENTNNTSEKDLLNKRLTNCKKFIL